ncbi:polyhydroxybutyrate depolymerase [Alteromonas pelagimontana]|uniref:Polyhydroxybutyrate depolymerase n=1 Tax=Alteromonas pelagimontana TaxID=1858656 RepID=A0A6M4MAP0_9ALTE|nr:PHB depolymerase family esterase [Alteromonas pelagimontana]QJR79730.1 polyhydroxybutyrate depolymerase [Alteromonas pelagimontana]
MKILLTAVLMGVTSVATADIPELNLDTQDVTVSGLSSGGYMATQFHIANSDWVKGAAVIAAGPYYCARNDITQALSQCVDKMEAPVDIATLNQQASQWESEGKIAPLSGLKDSKVWLLHGNRDGRVAEAISDLLAEQYKTWVPESSIYYSKNKPFAHVFPTKDKGSVCTLSESPFIGNCDYDAAGEMLSFLLDDLKVPDDTLSGQVISFSQTDIAGEDAGTMAKTGYAYVPADCATGHACKVHVSFHGCNQYAEAIGTDYVDKVGLNRWADDNQLVVIYPQTRKSLFMPLNPQGCWDWWGYTNENYATRDGVQIKAVRAIIHRLASN